MSFLKNLLAEKKEDMINEILSDEFQEEIVDKINKDYNKCKMSKKSLSNNVLMIKLAIYIIEK